MKKNLLKIVCAMAVVAVLMALCIGCGENSTVQTAQVVNAERINLSLNGIAEASDTSDVTLSFTIEPSYLIDKTVTWTVEWDDPTSSFASGKNAGDYVSVSRLTDSSASVSCLQSFGSPIKVVAVSNATPSVSAYCTFGYGERFDSFQLEFLGKTYSPYINPYPNGFDQDWDYHQWDPFYAYNFVNPVTSDSLSTYAADNNGLACNFVHDGSFTQSGTQTSIEYRVELSSAFSEYLIDQGFTNAGSGVVDVLDYNHVLATLIGYTGTQYYAYFCNNADAFNRAISNWERDREDARDSAYRLNGDVDQHDFDLYSNPCFDIVVTYSNEYCSVTKRFGFIFNYMHEIFQASRINMNLGSKIF